MLSCAGLRVMQTGATVTGWDKGEFERNGQLTAYGKDQSGPGTIVTAAHRNKGWMLAGDKQGVSHPPPQRCSRSNLTCAAPPALVIRTSA